jgi:MFS family permease
MKHYFHNMSFTSRRAAARAPHPPAARAPHPAAAKALHPAAATAGTVWRDVWIAAGSNLVTGMGTFLAMTTLILAMQEEGHGGLAVSGVIMADALPVVVLASLTGRLADRIDSRILLVAAGAIQVGACWGLSMSSGLPARIALLTLICCGTAIVMPTRQALMMTMAAREDLPRASGISSTANQIGAIAGPSLAGFAQGTLGTQITLKFAAVAFAATIAAGLLFRTRRGGAAAAGHHEAESGKVRMDSLLRTLTIGFAVVIGAVAAVNVIEVFFVKGTLGASSSAYGLITSMWTVGMIAGTWIAARLLKRVNEDGRIAVGSMLTLAGTCAIVVATSTVTVVWPMVGLHLIGGTINGAINVQIFTLFGRRVPAHARGRISARLQAAVQGAAILGYAVGGFALEAWTPRAVLAASGVAGVLAVVAVFPWILSSARAEDHKKRAEDHKQEAEAKRAELEPA